MNYKITYKSHYQRKKEAQRKKICWIVGALAVVLALALFIIDARDHARRVENMKKDHAEEMAECLTDWKAGKNGGCYWEEETVIFEGEPLTVDVEVIARPLD